MVGSIIATVGEGGEGGERRGGKEDSCVLLTEWRCELKSACQDKRTWDGHEFCPCIKGEQLCRQGLASPARLLSNCSTTSAQFTWLIAKTREGNPATAPQLMPHSDEELHECFYICLPFPRGSMNGSKLGK